MGDKLIDIIIENVNKYDKGLLKAQLRKLYLIGFSNGQSDEQKFIIEAEKSGCLKTYLDNLQKKD